MSMFTWRTEMRANLNGTDEDQAARRVDKLEGQAAMNILDDGRVVLHVMPDLGTFASAVIISADDAVALARVILERLA